MNEDYIKRINAALAYIEDNLQEDLSLDLISKIACYSPFHFHRLFKAITNEPLNVYINRKRIERAALQLVHNKKFSITEIAVQNGFKSNSSFTRSFSKVYGESPGNFRKTHSNDFSKIRKANSKIFQQDFITEEYFCRIRDLKNWYTMHAKIEIKETPEMKLAYITQIGVNGLESAFKRIVHWAKPKGLLSGKNSGIVRIFHDSFKTTDADKVRMSICIVLNNAVQDQGELDLTTIAGGKHIVGHFEIEPADFEKSWNSLFLWMSENGYRKADRNPFEIYRTNLQEPPGRKCFVDLCIPIE